MCQILSKLEGGREFHWLISYGMIPQCSVKHLCFPLKLVLFFIRSGDKVFVFNVFTNSHAKTNERF